MDIEDDRPLDIFANDLALEASMKKKPPCQETTDERSGQMSTSDGGDTSGHARDALKSTQNGRGRFEQWLDEEGKLEEQRSKPKGRVAMLLCTSWC